MTIEYFSNGNVKKGYLKETAIINKIKYYSAIEYYDNGNVKCGTIMNDLTIDNIVYKCYNEIYYFKNGKVKKGTLAKAQKIKGEWYSGVVEFDNNGNVVMNKYAINN